MFFVKKKIQDSAEKRMFWVQLLVIRKSGNSPLPYQRDQCTNLNEIMWFYPSSFIDVKLGLLHFNRHTERKLPLSEIVASVLEIPSICIVIAELRNVSKEFAVSMSRIPNLYEYWRRLRINCSPLTFIHYRYLEYVEIYLHASYTPPWRLAYAEKILKLL
jgi:hypothetical protein